MPDVGDDGTEAAKRLAAVKAVRDKLPPPPSPNFKKDFATLKAIATALVADLEKYVTDCKVASDRKEFIKKKNEMDVLKSKINEAVEAQKNDIAIMKRRLPEFSKLTGDLIGKLKQDKKTSDSLDHCWTTVMFQINHTEAASKIDD
jgi:hypothetical protein